MESQSEKKLLKQCKKPLMLRGVERYAEQIQAMQCQAKKKIGAQAVITCEYLGNHYFFLPHDHPERVARRNPKKISAGLPS